ncbi:hypothetical protein DIPPA_13557 [Diplonema papillatum]|nr:hypothetical protein DIPPA_13557 [Diplonema papillatum]
MQQQASVVWAAVWLCTVRVAVGSCDLCNERCGFLFEGSSADAPTLMIDEEFLGFGLAENCTHLASVHARYPEARFQISKVQDLFPTLVGGYDGTYSLLSDMLAVKDPHLGILNLDGQWCPSLAAHLEPLSEALLENVKPKFQVRDSAGRTVSLVHRANQIVTYYRRDLFALHGIEYRTDSWEAWEESVLALQTKERERRNDPTYKAMMYTYHGSNGRLAYNLATFLSGSGAGMVVEDDGTVSINNKEAIATLDMMRRWFSTMLHPDVHTVSGSGDTRTVMREDEAAVCFLWTSYSDNFLSYNRDNGWDIAAAPIPGPTGAGCSGSWSMGVTTYMPYKDVALEMISNTAASALYRTRWRPDQEPMDVRMRHNATLWAEYCEVSPILCESIELYPEFYDRITHRPSLGCGAMLDECIRIMRENVDKVMTGEFSSTEAVVQMEKELNVVLGTWDPSVLAKDETDHWTATRISLIVLSVAYFLALVALFLFMRGRIMKLRRSKSFTVPISVFLGLAVLVLFSAVQAALIGHWYSTLKTVSHDLGEEVRKQSLLVATRRVQSAVEQELQFHSSTSLAQMKRKVESSFVANIPGMNIDSRSLVLLVDRDTMSIPVSTDPARQIDGVSLASPLSADVSAWARAFLDILGGDLRSGVYNEETSYTTTVAGDVVFVNLAGAYASDQNQYVDQNVTARKMTYVIAYFVTEATILQKANDALREAIDLSLLLSFTVLIVVVYLATFITVPLTTLAYSMEDVRLMRMDDIQSGRNSLLTELSSLLLGFRSMCTMLEEYKSFMPKTLFNDDDSTSEDSSQPDSNPVGSRISGSKVGSKGSRGGSRVGSKMGSTQVSSALAHRAIPLHENGWKTKGATIVVFRLQERADPDGAGQLDAELLQKYVGVVEKEAKSRGGVLHSFHALSPVDLAVSWGLVGNRTANSIISMERAATALLNVQEAMRKELNEDVHAIAISGRMKAGNCGSRETRGFGIHGACVERIPHALRGCAALSELLQQPSFNLVNSDFARVPGVALQKRDVSFIRGCPALMGSISVCEVGEMKEWMYELEDLESKASPDTAFDTLLQAICSHQTVSAADVGKAHSSLLQEAKDEDRALLPVLETIQVLFNVSADCPSYCTSLVAESLWFRKLLRKESLAKLSRSDNTETTCASSKPKCPA